MIVSFGMKFPFPALILSAVVLAGGGIAAVVYATGTTIPSRAAVINPNPVVGVAHLSSSFVVFDISRFASTPDIVGNCDFQWKVARAQRNGDLVRIAAEISHFSPDCDTLTLRLKIGNKEAPIAVLHPTTKARVWSSLTDLPNEKLQKLAEKNSTGAVSKETSQVWGTKIANEILTARESLLPYLTPIAGKSVPTDVTSVPNSRRPYRENVTDGIHHAWDFYAPRGTAVRAVADGAIIRVRMNFQWADFQKIIAKPLSDADRAVNLDIFRGNQIWLKDAQGNVWMYDHLDRAAPDLAEGDFVTRGQALGFVGVSGVPDKDYTKPHLDISFAQNPHNASRAGTWTFLDIMGWDWWGKGMGSEWVLGNGKAIFK